MMVFEHFRKEDKIESLEINFSYKSHVVYLTV